MAPNKMVRLDSGGGAAVAPPGSSSESTGSRFTLIASSSAMRAYIDSLPEKLSLKDEIQSFQFWKSLRTEFLVSFLYIIFGFGSMISLDTMVINGQSLSPLSIVRNCSSVYNHSTTSATSATISAAAVPANLVLVANSLSSPTAPLPQSSGVRDQLSASEGSSSTSSRMSSSPSTAAATSATTTTATSTNLPELKGALALGLTVAALVQCAGHVSGCHLTIAITVGLFVSERVSSVRLASYLLVQLLGSCFGALVIRALFGFLPPVLPSPTLSVSQVFGFEFLATFLVVLTYLANCDSQRTDLGFKALSIGFAFTVAHLFAYPHSGASLSPARALAVSLLTQSWCLHWVYWISPFVAGLIGGLTYEYIGSSKPYNSPGNQSNGHTSATGGSNRNCSQPSLQPQYQTELRHKFTEKNAHTTTTTTTSTTAQADHRRSSGSVSRSSSSTQPSTIVCGGGLGGSTSNGGCTGMLTPETYSLNETEFTSIGGFGNDNDNCRSSSNIRY